MGYNTAGAEAVAARQADEDRVARAFVGFMSAALGVDQTYQGQDALIASPPGTFIVAAPDGSYSVLGQPVSNLNAGAPARAPDGINLFGIQVPSIVVLAGLGWLAYRALR